MSLPTIGVVIATPGRASLYRTLRSILYQGLIPGDDILIVGDGYHKATKGLVEAFGHPFRYVATKMTRDWGHSQLTWGLKRVGGDVVIYQDDDDIFLPRAFDEIRRLAARYPASPIIGRVKTPAWGILWSEPTTKTLLDGHCLVAPNEKKKLGYLSAGYNGDQCYISTTIRNYDQINWTDRVWTLTRPEWKLFPSRVQIPFLDVYTTNFIREMLDRLPSLECREMMGEHDWIWTFKTSSSHPVGALWLYEDEERVMVTMSYLPGEEKYIEEIVEFAAWAGQGSDVWFNVFANDHEIIEALRKKKFENHAIMDSRADFVLSWPPSFFPYRTAYEVTDEQGVHVDDWRDQWPL